MENYQKLLEKTILSIPAGTVPKLLLHSCCAPCSSYVLEYLSQHFEITVLYYNPNISPAEEYEKRIAEQENLIRELKTTNPLHFLAGNYNPEEFHNLTRGLEDCPEGGERCLICYRMRLEKTADFAKIGDFDYFTTTLTISPMKNAEVLNTIGSEIGEIYGVLHLPSDFKKKEGYKRSIALSKDFGLYRQDYCGCIFSKLK